ncbi:MAG: hypothetical protein J0H98_03230 [Solirubrobacterales bacterium]|nr:hypothetical protein [Solirubrobacterales bacterium]
MLAAVATPAQASSLPSFPLPPEGGGSASISAGAEVLVRQDANLTVANRAGGMPTSSVPGRQLAGATIKVETYGQGTSTPTYFVNGAVTLAGVPTSDPDAELNLGFGHRKGTVCELAALLTTDTGDYWGTRYEFVGYNPDYFPTPSRPWECVAVFLDDSFSGTPPTATYDAFVAPLVDTRESPRLSVTRVDLLGQKQKTLRLVPGVATRIGVSFRNAGKVATGKLTVKGSGKGIRVRSQRTGPLASESSGSASVPVRLTGRQKKTSLRIVVGDGSTRAVRKLRVVRVKPPRRPLAGSYRSPSGNVRFDVRGGRMIGWTGTMTTRCGGFPDPYTYSTNTYSFPSRKIPRNGILQTSARGSNYGTSLRLRIVGGKVTRGLFNYAGPARCSASLAFEAKRAGR